MTQRKQLPVQVNVVKVSKIAKSIQQFAGGKADGESQPMFCCKMYGMKCNAQKKKLQNFTVFCNIKIQFHFFCYT